MMSGFSDRRPVWQLLKNRYYLKLLEKLCATQQASAQFSHFAIMLTKMLSSGK